MILRQARTPGELRAKLLEFAKTREKDNAIGSGEAWFFRGNSFSRASQPDSAIECWRHAMTLRGALEDREALSEGLLARNGPGDADRTLALLEPAYNEARGMNDPNTTRIEALFAWAQYVAGQAGPAREMFTDLEPRLFRSRRWSYRCAIALMGGADPRHALQLLRPSMVASRGQDADLVQLMQKAADLAGLSNAMSKDLVDLLATRDRVEQRVIDRMGGRRIRFAASDGFALSGVAIVPDGVTRPRAAIVMMAPSDTVADYDSLTTALQASGCAVLLMDARGSGWAVGPDCPLPEAWRGREEAMLHRSALDVRDGVRALSLTAKVDTANVVLVASGEMAMAAAEAAERDRRVRALVLLSPDPDPVDFGVLPATLARRPLPTFFQQTAEDWPHFEITDLALHAARERFSRISDARSPGVGAVAFQHDARVTPRFTQWLREALAAPLLPGPPPARPRKG
jgi:hypothetical protein